MRGRIICEPPSAALHSFRGRLDRFAPAAVADVTGRAGGGGDGSSGASSLVAAAEEGDCCWADYSVDIDMRLRSASGEPVPSSPPSINGGSRRGGGGGGAAGGGSPRASAASSLFFRPPSLRTSAAAGAPVLFHSPNHPPGVSCASGLCVAGSHPLSIENVLLRGAKLKNSGWVVGVVVATGTDARIFRNILQNRPMKARVRQRAAGIKPHAFSCLRFSACSLLLHAAAVRRRAMHDLLLLAPPCWLRLL